MIQKCRGDAQFLTRVDKRLSKIIRKPGDEIFPDEMDQLIADLGNLVADVKSHGVGEAFRETKQSLLDALAKVKKGWEKLADSVTQTEANRADAVIQRGMDGVAESIEAVSENRSDCLSEAETPPSG